MNLIYLDTSGPYLSIGLTKADQDFIKTQYALNEQAALILPALRELLAQGQLDLHQNIDAVFWAQGPGSFTGLRIAGSVAQALTLVIEKPLLGLSTLQVQAQSALQAHALKNAVELSSATVFMDARRGECYRALYRNNQGIMQQVGQVSLIQSVAREVKPHAENETVVFYDPLPQGQPDLNHQDRTILAALQLARYYYRGFDPLTYDVNKHLVPDYVRDPV